jgi:hypothetical protein
MPDNRNLDNRDLDALIDEALSSYTAAEPDPSLRTRIMARAAEAAPRPRHLWLLAPAAACAAALVIAFFLHPVSRAPRPEPSTATNTAIAPAPALAPVRALPQQTVHRDPTLATQRTRRSERPTLVRNIRNATFPSPAPLTAQETTLLKFATEHPDQARQVLAAPASRPIESAPLAIASIYIPALSEAQQSQ